MNISHISRLVLSAADEALVCNVDVQCQVNCKAVPKPFFDKGSSNFIRISLVGSYVESGNLRRLHKTSWHTQ